MVVRRLSILRWRQLVIFRSHFAVTLLPGGTDGQGGLGGKLGGGVGLQISLDSKATKEKFLVTACGAVWSMLDISASGVR